MSNNNGDREKIHQVEQLIANPWLSRTNIHVIRNFDLLLTMFEGLENTYKKGYERKKIENLFTNLEYVQLYDRHFDVPDFGVAPILPKKDKGETGLGTKSI